MHKKKNILSMPMNYLMCGTFDHIYFVMYMSAQVLYHAYEDAEIHWIWKTFWKLKCSAVCN